MGFSGFVRPLPDEAASEDAASDEAGALEGSLEEGSEEGSLEEGSEEEGAEEEGAEDAEVGFEDEAEGACAVVQPASVTTKITDKTTQRTFFIHILLFLQFYHTFSPISSR